MCCVGALVVACDTSPIDEPDDAGVTAARDAVATFADASIPADAEELAADAADAAAENFPDAAEAHPDATVEPADAGSSTPVRNPVVFVHGINGSSADFTVMLDRLVADGWPREQLYAISFEDPRWGCNADNAETIRMTVDQALLETGAAKVDLVAHSMGTLSSRHYLKNLGGFDKVDTYVTLGGLYFGNQLSCLNPLPVCVWQELCPDNAFLSALNADPPFSGDGYFVSICSRTDDTATLETCHFDASENIEVDGVDHAGPMGLLEHADVYPHVVRVLEYPPR